MRPSSGACVGRALTLAAAAYAVDALGEGHDSGTGACSEFST